MVVFSAASASSRGAETRDLRALILAARARAARARRARRRRRRHARRRAWAAATSSPGCGLGRRMDALRRSRPRAARSTSGSSTKKVAPWPSPWLVGPDRAAVQFDQLLARSPSPARGRRKLAWSSCRCCEKRSKTCGRKLAGMPMPVSLTLSSMCEFTRCSSTWTWPPLGVNLIALVSRFQTTCCSRAASPLTTSRCADRGSLSGECPWRRAAGCAESTAASTTLAA